VCSTERALTYEGLLLSPDSGTHTHTDTHIPRLVTANCDVFFVIQCKPDLLTEMVDSTNLK